MLFCLKTYVQPCLPLLLSLPASAVCRAEPVGLSSLSPRLCVQKHMSLRAVTMVLACEDACPGVRGSGDGVRSGDSYYSKGTTLSALLLSTRMRFMLWVTVTVRVSSSMVKSSMPWLVGMNAGMRASV